MATKVNRRTKRAVRAVLALVGVRKPNSAAAGGASGTAGQARRQANQQARQQAVAARGPLVAGSRPPASEREKATEAEALTIFGARGNIRQEPSIARRGLMLGGGVVLLLVAVAVWFIYFSGTGPQPQMAANDAAETVPMADIVAPQRAETVQDTVTAAAPLLPDNSGVPVSAPEPVPDAVVVQAPPAVLETAVEQGLADADGRSDPDQLLEALVQDALSEAIPSEALDRAEEIAEASGQPSAQTDVAAQATPEVSTQVSDSPQVVSAVDTPDLRLTLPAGIDVPDTSEVAFASPAPPPPFGAQFTFDANGLVEATRDGALTPEGVTVFAGRPTVVPALRPGGVAPVVAPEPVASTPAPEAPAVESPVPAQPPVAQATPDDTPRADPALAAARPLPRSPRVTAIGGQGAPATPEPGSDPEPLPVPEADTNNGAVQQEGADQRATDTDSAALEAPPPGGVSLTGLRPQTRPTDLVPPLVDITPEEAAEIDTEGSTAEAVAASVRPSARPSDVAERAQAALAAAANTAASSRGTGGEQNNTEPARAAAAPVIPSSASVARQATETGAINLRTVNLIGVFGTPTARRALVRLSSGRIERVQVGDRLDGGQVTAISDSELRYTKNGRNEILIIGG